MFPKRTVTCLACSIHRSGTVADKLYLGNLLNSTGKGAGMILLKNVRNYGGVSFPFFSRMGRCRLLSLHFRECRFGVGWVLVQARTCVCCVYIQYNTYIPWIHVSQTTGCGTSLHIYKFTVSNTTNILQKIF